MVVRILFARYGSFSCVVSTTAVRQQLVDREGGMLCVKKVENRDDAAHAH